LVRPEIHSVHRSWPAFRLCGYVGFVAGVVLAEVLAVALGRSSWVMSAIVATAVLTLLSLVMTVKIVTGEEQLTYYRDVIAVMLVTRALLWLLDRPALPYLDFTILGLGLFLACGRVGCLMVGCCHGRPYAWGVSYRLEHIAAGFPSYLADVRLFPIQALESLWVLVIVIEGTVLVLAGYPPGTALTWYVVTYCVGRFGFEFMRGDPGRRYVWGFSEAQWTSALLVCALSGAELAGLLPFHWWHTTAAIALVCTLAAVGSGRRLRRTPKHQLLHPRHIKEVAEVIKAVSRSVAISSDTFNPRRDALPIHIGCTSLGVQVSGGHLSGIDGSSHHYALSNRAGNMTRDAAQTLARLILQLQRASGRSEIIGGGRGVFHLLYTMV
jgi:prolipoprotein diacylglyceryltransferase